MSQHDRLAAEKAKLNAQHLWETINKKGQSSRMSSPHFFRQKRKNDYGLSHPYIPELVSKVYFDRFELTHSSGDSLAFYRDEYVTLRDYAVRKFELKSFDQISKQQFLDVIAEQTPKIIRYFTKASLAEYQLDIHAFNADYDIRTINGLKASREPGQQNCFVINDGVCYMAPKKIAGNVGILNKDAEDKMGINHSSMSANGNVQYAGSLSYEKVPAFGDTEFWVLDNATGHYATRPFHMTTALQVLQSKGIDLDRLLIKSHTQTYQEHPQPAFEVHYQRAGEFYRRYLGEQETAAPLSPICAN